MTLLAASLVACDTGDVATPRFDPLAVAPARDFASGARLRARYQVVGGVVDVFTTFHDLVLDADCAFEDENGAHVGPGSASYCYPAGVARHRDKSGPYLDAACTVAAAPTPTSGAASRIAVEPFDACTTAPTFFAAGPPRIRNVFASDGSGGCTPQGRLSVQTLDDALPPDTFVRAVEQIEPRPGRMGVRVLVGDDGSRRVIGGFDQARFEPVRAGMGEDGVPRWLPARTAFVGGGEPLFADAACSVSVASKIARTATCPISAAVVLHGACGLGSYFALGEPLTALFRGDATRCVAGVAPDVLSFRLGAPIAPSAYEPVVTVEVGSVLARRRGVGASGDGPIAWTEVIAGATRETCEVVPTADGTLRCLPATSEGIVLFADSACSEPAFAHPVGCESGPAPRYVRSAFEATSKGYEVGRELGVVYEVGARGCGPFTPPVASRAFAVKEIDPTLFPIAVPGAD